MYFVRRGHLMVVSDRETEGNVRRIDLREVEIVYTRRHVIFFFSSRRRHTRLQGDWSSDVCSSDLLGKLTNEDSAATKPDTKSKGKPKPSFAALVDDTKLAEDVEEDDDIKPLKKIGRASCRERV